MKPETEELCLRPGVAVFQDEGGYGLRCGTQSRYAKDAAQTAILQAVEQHRLALDALIEAAGGSGSDKLHGGLSALAVAEFILDFEAYLENGKGA